MPQPKRVEVDVLGRTLSLSNLDKVLYPAAGFTKGHVIDYYTRIAPYVLPHLQGRALTLKRYPNGVEAQHFYEKNAPSHRPGWVNTATIPIRTDGRTIDFVLADDLPTLVWLANLADLELHTSLAKAADPKAPTIPPSTSTRARRPRSSSARRWRCTCARSSGTSGWRASRRRRARRACRSTCR
jgi:bifunctional non-homologous end joining protein LigD